MKKLNNTETELIIKKRVYNKIIKTFTDHIKD